MDQRTLKYTFGSGLIFVDSQPQHDPGSNEFAAEEGLRVKKDFALAKRNNTRGAKFSGSVF